MKIFILAASLILSVNFAYAGPAAIKTLKDEADKKVNAAVTIIKKDCGNKELNVKIDWNRWEKSKIKEENTKNMGHVGGLAAKILENMSESCSDKNKKTEIAKIVKVNFSGKKKKIDYDQAAFEVKGKTLHVKLNVDAVGTWKNKETLDKVW